MPTTLVALYLNLLDEAFEGPEWSSLLSNLASVTPADWLWVPAGGRRSIRDIVAHVGGCKIVYHDQAFGDGTLTWDAPLVVGGDALDTVPSAIVWLRNGHARLRHSIAALDDSDLPRPRSHHSGKLKETRWIIWTMIKHDLYHAGEINHLRALHQQNDD